MLYNKNQLSKQGDKKVLRKVKKQWVVMSMASFAMVGTAMVLQSQPTAHADSLPAQTQTTNAQTAAVNNVDDSATYQAQIQQGYTDAYQKKGNNASALSGQASNYYTAAYTGATSAMNAYNKATQGTGAGTQDYNYYGNTVVKNDGYANDSTNAQTGSQGFTGKRQTQGDNQQAKTVTSNTQNTTASTPNPTDGTPLGDNNTNDTNQGGADNPKDASNSVSNYESTMVGKLNTATNVSVKSTGSTLSVPTSTDAGIQADRAQYANALGLSKAFDMAVNYVFAQQGQNDAETGKWQGVYQGSNGATKDYYLSSAQPNINNPYDQAYRGARDAMNKYFTNNNYNGNTSVSASNTGNANYDQGFNDVVNQATNGTVFVQNGYQYASVMTGSNTPNTVGGNVANGIQTVKLANDIDLTGATNGENDGTIYTNFATLTVDGQHHMMDFHGNNYTVNRPGSGSLDVYLQNFQTMYGANYFGAFRAEPGAVFHFSNINYVGPQLLSSYSNDTYFSGRVNVLVPTASTYYTSPFQSNVLIEGAGNQENLEVNNFILEPNSTYFGNTSPALGGTNIVVTGNLTLGENAKMTLVPRGGNGGAATIADGATWGIWLKNAGASLNINKNAIINIIPQLLSNTNYPSMMGGAVYTGTNVSININGGTLNYEGYKGIAGYYNQPIDLQGSNQTQINVINGGLLQVLMDSIPNVTNGYTSAGNQASYDALINNVGQGSFNVGSKGNLKVGVTNSDGQYNVPYYGPININSVGSNHAVFLKPTTINQFQTTTGNAGAGYAGAINAYSVAITQADGSKQYLYNFQLQSGSTNYTGVDFNGNNVSGKISGNTLDIADVPAVQFVGPLTKNDNGDGTTTVSGFAKLSNYKELNNSPIYVGIASSNSNGSYNQLTQVANSTIKNQYSKADPNTYTFTVDTTGYTGGLIPISYKVPTASSAYVGMRLHYGINSVNSVLGPNSYNTTVEGYQAAGNGMVAETANGDMQVANVSLSNINAGVADALNDSIGKTTSNKDAEPFNTKTNGDYLAAYNSIQAGYAAYSNSNANMDYTKLDAYINSSNPSAFAQGFKEAAYQAGLRDARFNQNNVTGNANYDEAQSTYAQAYQAALNAGPGASVSSIIAQNNLPTSTSNGTNASAVTTAISDAQGALAFITDEQNADINGAGLAGLNGDKAKITAYNDTETGYNNALTVSPSSNNPDVSSDKAEEAGFEYGQSLINGGLSNSTPTTTNAHMVNLQAAISGYNAAQAAVTKAKSTNISIIQRGLKGGSHEKMSTDNYLGDLTAYQSIKFGAYTGLNNQSDRNLNQLEKVGYDAVVVPVATQAGQQSFMNKTGNTPTGIAALSQTGSNAFTGAYGNSSASFEQGKKDGLSTVTANPKASDMPTSVPSNVADATAYNTGYKGSVDGYSDGSATSAGTQTAKDTTQPAVYNDAYNAAYAQGRQTAGGNDYVAYKQPKATDNDYTTGYNKAAQGYSDGYKDAQTQANPTPTKSAEIPYVTGYNAGVSDERIDAQSAADDQGYVDGATQFLQNKELGKVTKDATKSDKYNANVDSGFTAASQGFADAQTGVDNSAQIANASQKSAYLAGADQFKQAQAQLNADVAAGKTTPANDVNGAVTKTVANDVFNSTLANLTGNSYTPTTDANGALAQGISKVFTPTATTAYNAGIPLSQANPKATSDNPFTEQAIKDYADGYNGNANGNKNSSAYVQGQSDKQAVKDGITAVQANASATSANPQSTNAINGYQQAYNDALLNGGAKDVSSQPRAYQDAYAQGIKDANNAGLRDQALAAVAKNAGNPFSGNSLNAVVGSNVYNSVAKGAADAASGATTPALPNDPNYMAGFDNGNQANAEYSKAERQNLPQSDPSHTDTYNGAADAINAVNAHGTMPVLADDGTHTKPYVAAYNKALSQANDAVAKALADFKAGKQPDDSQLDSVANKAIYNNAYKADQKGYNAGISGQAFPVNTLGNDGYVLGQQANAGYAAAVKKAIYGKDTNGADQLPTYQPALNGIADAKAGNAVQSNDPAYNYAYAQQKAVQNALTDLGNKNTANKAVPTGLNADVYNTAYQATVDGYNDGHAGTVAGSSNKQSDTRPVYTASYDQGFDAGRVQQGADDYLSSNVDNNTYSLDANYKKGVDDASHGFYDGKNKSTPSSTQPTYTAGYNQGSGAADGIERAQPSVSSDKKLTDDALSGYYGVKDAYAHAEGATTLPSDGKGINKNNAYTDAYKDATTDANNAIAQGAKAFATSQPEPTSDGTVQGDATAYGYKRAEAGFSDAIKGNISASDPAYTSGANIYRDAAYGAQFALMNGKVDANASDIAKVAGQAELDGLAGKDPSQDNDVYKLIYAPAKAIYDKQKAMQDALDASNAQRDKANQDASDANAKANQAAIDKATADAQRDAALKAQQDAQAAQAKAEADKANAEQVAQNAQQAQAQAEQDKANAVAAQQQAEASQADAVKAQQQAEADKASAEAQRDAAIKAQQQADADKATAEAQRDAALKAQQDAQAQASQAGADKDAAVKAMNDAKAAEAAAEARANQADTDKANAVQAQQDAEARANQADIDKANAIKAQQDAQAQASQAATDRDNAIKAMQQAQADKATADSQRDDAIKAMQQAQSQAEAASKAQTDAEAQRDAAVKAMNDAKAQADKEVADAQKAQQDAQAQATQAEADKDAAVKASQQAQADKANADAQRDAALKAQADAQAAQAKAEQDAQTANANTTQAEADKEAAIKAMNDAKTAQSNAEQAQSDAVARAEKADADRAAAIKAEQQAEADKAQAIADKDAAVKAQQTAEANAQQADTDRDNAIKAMNDANARATQADTDKANALKAQADAEANAKQSDADKQQAEAQRDAALKAQQQADADKATAEAQRDDAVKAQQSAEADKATADAQRDAAVQAQKDAEARADKADADKAEAIKAQHQAEADKAQAVADMTNAVDAMNNAKDAQAKAEKAQADAEQRADKAEADKAQADTDRDNAIKARQQAEADKATADSQRDDAIKAANTAKTAQAQAEKAQADAEDKMTQAQDAQAKAEQAQATADKQRDDALKAQQTAEQKANDVQAQLVQIQHELQIKTVEITKVMADKSELYKREYIDGYNMAMTQAAHGKMASAKFLKAQPEHYNMGYNDGFKNYMKINMPRYVYNYGNVNSYKSINFSKKTKSRHYNKKHRRSFRVYKALFDKHGNIRYEIKGHKFVTNNWKYIRPTYYAPSKKSGMVKTLRNVIIHKHAGYSARKRAHNSVLHKGKKIHVLRTVRYHGITRFVVKGGYITSNKMWVKRLFNI